MLDSAAIIAFVPTTKPDQARRFYVSIEYASGFLEPAVVHLPALFSPRNERQCRTGS